MNAITHIPSPDAAAPPPHQAAIDNPEIPPTLDPLEPAFGFTPSRWDGWTPERQKVFVEAISEGRTIKQACRIVGLSPQSAYAFRRRPQGAAFALAWQAACLLVRDEFADELMDRARNGVFETITYRNGDTVERHRFDNRLAASLLARLDRLADRVAGDVSHAAARLVAAEFDPFVALLGRGPARAGMFLGARAEEASQADLEPLRTLARADRWLRTHSALAGEVDASDLDPARRGEWTAEQWARAEAAGLLALAPAPTPSAGKVDQPIDDGTELEPPVWWDDNIEEWRTRYPAPPGFLGDEDGDYGDPDYSRELTPEEAEALEGPRRAELAERARAEAAERDALFGFVPAPPPPQEDPLALAIEAALESAAAPGAEDAEDADDFGDEDENWDYSKDAALLAGELPDSEVP